MGGKGVIILRLLCDIFPGKAGTGMDREVSLVLKHGAEAKDYDKVLKNDKPCLDNNLRLFFLDSQTIN